MQDTERVADSFFFRDTLIIILADGSQHRYVMNFAKGPREVYSPQATYSRLFEMKLVAKRQVLKAEVGRSSLSLMLIGYDGRIYQASEESRVLGYKEGLFVSDYSALEFIETFPDVALSLVRVKNES